MLIRVLVSMERADARRRVQALLSELGALVRVRRSKETLWERLHAETFDLIVADGQAMPHPITETIASVRALPNPPDIVLVARVKDSQQRAELLAAGCLGLLSPNLGNDTLRESLSTLLARRQESGATLLEREEADAYRLGDFISTSPAMQQLIRVAQRVAASDTTALILGETGVGKEALARALHSEGPRFGGPFVAVNCAAIPETLFESELFGHTRGAFTGATRDRRGYFEMAHQGTLFLDEVADLPRYLQVKLLRVLQERVIQRIGSPREVEIDVRVLAATNRSPQDEIAAGRLREDLYYRLGVVTLEIPPLRERHEDIAELAENYFRIFRTKIGRGLHGIDSNVMSALAEYAWPGNVRELINVIERAVLLATGDYLTLDELPDELSGRASREVLASASADEPGGHTVWDESLRVAKRRVVEDFERRYLMALLGKTRGRVGETARLADINPRLLYDKMRRLGLRKEHFR